MTSVSAGGPSRERGSIRRRSEGHLSPESVFCDEFSCLRSREVGNSVD